VPQRVTLFHGGERPCTTVLTLVVEEHQLQVISSPAELATGGPPADVVVVEVPAKYRRAACEQLRRHYHGRLIVLLDPGDSCPDLPPDPNRTLLAHPVAIHELSAALAGSAPFQSTGDPRLVLPRRAQFHGADPGLGTGRGMVAEVVPWLAQSWRERRLVRVSTISVTVALLVTAAFVLVTQGAGCGSACDELTDANLTFPSSTTFIAVAPGQDTTDSSTGIVGPAGTDSTAGPAAAGGDQADGATSSTPGVARTTAGSSGAPNPTSPPDPTLPASTAPTTAAPTTTPTTIAPTTTAPTTTAPTTSTATATTAPPHPTPPPHPTKP
jgi:hypothetical protein